MNRFVVVDLALRSGSDKPMAEAMRPDFTVAFYCEMWGRECHIRDCLFGRWNGPQAGNNLFRWNRDLHGSCPVFLEGSNAADVAAHIRNNTSGMKLEICEIPIDHKPDAKLHRCATLIGEIENGFIKVDLPEHSDARILLDAQLRAFPKQSQAHDDFRDTLSLVPVALDIGVAGANPPTLSSGQSDGQEPSAAGDPLEWARWLREHSESKTEDDDPGYRLRQRDAQS
jgi:hypothetical protein